MSAVVKLSSKLPGDPEINGLDARADDMLSDPEEMIVAIVYFDTVNIIEDIDAGTRVPVARIRRLEPLGSFTDVPDTVRDAMAKAEQRRTGRTPIPFETVEAGEGKHADPIDGVDD